jgi:hypothetical protein
MNRTRLPLLAGAFSLVLVAWGMRAVQGCYAQVSNDGLVDTGPAPDVSFDAGADSGFVGVGDSACSSEAGVLPDPNCHVPFVGTALSCTSSGSVCAVTKNSDGTSCGEPLCLNMATNVAPVYNFRMEAIYVASPPILSAKSLVASAVVTPSVGLNQGTCGYYVGKSSLGTVLAGAFNWIIQVNTETKMLTTGGAPPVTDPYGKGYCFVDETDTPDGGMPIPLKPLVAPVEINGNTVTGKPQTTVLNIPIFQSSSNLKDPIVLPIRGAEIQFTMSTDGNCIGDINPDWYQFAGSGSAGCQDRSPDSCPKWFTNGSLAGYITLADAQNVFVAALGENLCALLETESTCMPNMGDYCSTTGTAGGCKDSFWLSATFAANAVKINPTGAAPCAQ